MSEFALIARSSKHFISTRRYTPRTQTKRLAFRYGTLEWLLRVVFIGKDSPDYNYRNSDGHAREFSEMSQDNASGSDYDYKNSPRYFDLSVLFLAHSWQLDCPGLNHPT